MAREEKNVFRDAKFGDKFLTRNGQVMIYQKQAREDVYCLFDEEGDCVIEYRPNGDVIYDYTGDAEPQEDDIVKKYVQPSLPSDLDEAANKFAVFYDQGTCDGIAQECFKAGVKWDREQMMKETERIPKPELTWEDIAKIDALILEANNEFAVDYSKEISREQFYTEVLNRFNKSKKKEK